MLIRQFPVKAFCRAGHGHARTGMDTSATLVEASRAPLPLRAHCSGNQQADRARPCPHTRRTPPPTSSTAPAGRSRPRQRPACHSSSPARAMREGTSPRRGRTSEMRTQRYNLLVYLFYIYILIVKAKKNNWQEA